MAFCPKGDTEVNVVIKYVLLIGTFIHWLIGLAMVVGGAWAYSERSKYYYQPVEDIYDLILDLSIVLMALGIGVFLVAFCGFVGALRENTCLLTVFYICLSVVFLLEVTASVLAFVFKDKAKEFLADVLEEVYIIRYQDDEDSVMDFFQEEYKCCGINSYTDWNDNEYFNCTASNPSAMKCSVPYSCCKDPDELSPGLINILCGGNTLEPKGNTTPAGTSTVSTDKIFTSGCVDVVIRWIEDNLPLIGGVAAAIAVPQILGIVLGRMFVGQIQYQQEKYLRTHRSFQRYR